MSSPPPGGPQTPQPPYPQAPPPQYAPQYPPQQPYYAQPVTPPPKKSNTALIIVLVVVVIVVVLAVLAWYAITVIMRPITSNTQVTVTGVSWTIDYPGTVYYFGTSPLTTCSTCPFTESLFTQFQYTLSLTNGDTVAHNVTDILLTGATFALISGSPTTSSPVSIGAGATHNFLLTIQTTTFGGSYTLTGTVDTN